MWNIWLFIPELKRSPKLLWLDTGIVNYVAGIQKEVFSVQDIADAWRGKIAEHIVGQELLSGKTDFLAQRHFWVRNAHSSDAEIDFIIQHDSRIIPVEVKSAENLNAKSLKIFCEKFKPANAIRTSLSDYRKESWLTNVPLYLIGNYLNEHEL